MAQAVGGNVVGGEERLAMTGRRGEGGDDGKGIWEGDG
jgi:hypothetical protein